MAIFRLSKRAQHEQEFFDNLASQNDVFYYWGWKTEVGRYRHHLRATIICSFLNLKPGVKSLELGCYMGELTKKIAPTKATITATDIAPKSIVLAKKTVKKNINFLVDNIEKSKLKSNFFDSCFGNGILHHTHLDSSLKEIKRVLKPGGKFIFFEPNILNPEIFLERKIPYLRKLSHSSPDETAFVRFELKKTLEKSGFINVKVEPF